MDSNIENIILQNQIRIMFALAELVGADSGQYLDILNRIEITNDAIKMKDVKN